MPISTLCAAGLLRCGARGRCRSAQGNQPALDLLRDERKQRVGAHGLAKKADRAEFSTLRREELEATAFTRPRDYAAHFKARYGPTIAARANAEKNGVAGDLDTALDAFSDEWNRGTEDQARFEIEYLLAVGTRAG